MPTLDTLTLTIVAPLIPLKVRLEDREFWASLGFVTPVPLISTLTTVELTPCVRDVSLEVFWQLGSPTFKLSGIPAQIESAILFVLLIALASLMLSESELVKMLVFELPGPRVI